MGEQMGPEGVGGGTKRVPWRVRPRLSFWDAAPSWRFLQAAWAFPSICLGFVAAWGLGGPRPLDVPFMIAFSIIAGIETLFLLAWLRRPVDKVADRGRGNNPPHGRQGS